MPDSSPDLGQKVQPPFLGQVPQITDQVCNGVIVTAAAVLLEYRDTLGGPSDVLDLSDHLCLN